VRIKNRIFKEPQIAKTGIDGGCHCVGRLLCRKPGAGVKVGLNGSLQISGLAEDGEQQKTLERCSVGIDPGAEPRQTSKTLYICISALLALIRLWAECHMSIRPEKEAKNEG